MAGISTEGAEFAIDFVTSALKAGEKEAEASENTALASALKTAGGNIEQFAAATSENPEVAAVALVAALAVTTALAPEIETGAAAFASSAVMSTVARTMTTFLVENSGLEIVAARQLVNAAISGAYSVVVDGYFSEVTKSIINNGFGIAGNIISALGGSQQSLGNLSTPEIVTPSSLPQGDNFFLLSVEMDVDETGETWNLPDSSATSPGLDISYNGTDFVDVQSGSWSSITLTGTIAEIAYTDGTSATATVNPDGSTTTETFSGPNGTGPVIGTDTEEPDGASLVVTGQIISNSGSAV
jgi:hypothetical protein